MIWSFVEEQSRAEQSRAEQRARRKQSAACEAPDHTYNINRILLREQM